MMSQVAARMGLALLAMSAACGCVLMLGCGDSRDLDELGVPRPPDAGVWYLDALEHKASDDGAAGSAGSVAVDDGSSPTGSGSRAGTSGGAGTGGGAGSSGGTGGAGSGAGSVPLPAAGTSGFPFPGGGSGSGGFMIPGGGQGMGMAPPPPPSEDVSSCSPCESISGSLGGVPACCTDDNQCGADLSALGGSAGCVAREQPGSMSNECPSISIMNGGFDIPGCCRATGRCGITIMRLAPLGCVDPSVVEDLLMFDSPAGRPGRCTP